MTREEILAVPEGQELNALVAAKVMGCKPVRKPGRWVYLCGCPDVAHGHCYDDMQTSDLEPYSTDIAAAWLVVEKLRQTGWSCKLTDYPQDILAATEYPWVAEFVGHGRGVSAEDFSLPMAICQAALLATLEPK